MEAAQKQRFVLAIAGQPDDQGRLVYFAAEANSGVPLEQIITITRMWLKKTEQQYFEKFHDRF